ncbi:helix-turn-helix domain-containing protein [Nocardia spumae]|uniref:helix-turn-helix domain-containing protein n=1 Tax=Nocardia spumae TaxID=2887190 RepID=UPI0027DF3A73|nr:helix-turn-helix domain-containing protein [Nocardia spumae]
MHIHPNTFSCRLRRVAELTGIDPTDPHGSRFIAAAPTVHQLHLDAAANGAGNVSAVAGVVSIHPHRVICHSAGGGTVGCGPLHAIARFRCRRGDDYGTPVRGHDQPRCEGFHRGLGRVPGG